MSFLKKLFGGSGPTEAANNAAAESEYEGYRITATPIAEGGQYRVCALIRKEVGGETKEHKLIRADMCGSLDEAAEMSFRKSRQMIDEQGDRIFS